MKVNFKKIKRKDKEFFIGVMAVKGMKDYGRMTSFLRVTYIN
jgi:hypothetical protein